MLLVARTDPLDLPHNLNEGFVLDWLSVGPVFCNVVGMLEALDPRDEHFRFGSRKSLPGHAADARDPHVQGQLGIAEINRINRTDLVSCKCHRKERQQAARPHLSPAPVSRKVRAGLVPPPQWRPTAKMGPKSWVPSADPDGTSRDRQRGFQNGGLRWSRAAAGPTMKRG